MNKIILTFIFVVALAFALPAILNAFMAILPALLASIALVGISVLLFQRRRRWLRSE